jgi:hypothetical protein
MEELQLIRQKLAPITIKYNAQKTYPHLMDWKPVAADVPDEIVDPAKLESSLIFELLAYEMVACKIFNAGYFFLARYTAHV